MPSSNQERLISIRDIARWSLHFMAVLCWILSVVTMGACDFYEVEYLQDEANGLGLFTVQEGGSKCTSYENFGIDLDSGLEAGRAFGIFTNFALLVGISMNVVLHWLPDGADKRDFAKRIAVWAYSVALLSNFFTFSIAGSELVKNACGDVRSECTLGAAGGAAVANVFMLLITAATLFCSEYVDFAQSATNQSAANQSTTNQNHPQRNNPRTQRLKNGEIKVLYHQTDQRSAESIRKSGKLLRGSSGLAGGGIYFAESPKQTHAKAQKKGCMAICKVQLGNVKRLTSSGDGSMTFQKLQSEGYDSVVVARGGGDEYVVYNYDQVEVVDVTEL